MATGPEIMIYITSSGDKTKTNTLNVNIIEITVNINYLQISKHKNLKEQEFSSHKECEKTIFSNQPSKVHDLTKCVPSEESKNLIVLIGNPGVGKSTLLNCIMNTEYKQKEVSFFRSGVSIGCGLTKNLQTKTIGNTEYVDTPGLQDIEMRECAAIAITEALKMNGWYKIMFVITLEAGRIRTADVACMKMVLDCARGQIESFGIIINKLTNKLYQQLSEGDEKLKVMSQVQLCTGNNNVQILLVKKRNELEDENDVVQEMPELIEYLEDIPRIQIDPNKIDDIPADDTFEKRIEELEKSLKDLEESNKEIQGQIEKNKILYNKTIADEKQKQEMVHKEKVWKLKKNYENEFHQVKENIKHYKRESDKLKLENALTTCVYSQWV